jgi:N-acetylmuramoyl-L-alanine amidase
MPRSVSARVRRRRVLFGAAILVVVVVVVARLAVAPLVHRDDHLVKVDRQSGEGKPVDPSRFSDGACITFPPTKGNRHLTVFLDAGHGGVDVGGTGATESGQTLYEATETLPMELDAMAHLRAGGFTVTVSRVTDTTVTRLLRGYTDDGVLSVEGAHQDVAARDVCANLAGARALVGIYLDTGSSPANAGSITAYDRDRPFVADNLRLAQLVQTDVLSALNARGWGIPDGGVLPDDALGSLSSSNGALGQEAAAYDHLLLLGPAETGYFDTPSLMPGALIEPLFITDPFEGSLAASVAGQEAVGQGVAQAVESYFAPVGHHPSRR